MKKSFFKTKLDSCDTGSSSVSAQSHDTTAGSRDSAVTSRDDTAESHDDQEGMANGGVDKIPEENSNSSMETSDSATKMTSAEKLANFAFKSA